MKDIRLKNWHILIISILVFIIKLVFFSISEKTGNPSYRTVGLWLNILSIILFLSSTISIIVEAIKKIKNKTIKLIVIIGLCFMTCLVMVLFFFNKNSKIKDNNIILNNENSLKIVTNLYAKIPTFALFNSFNKENFIFSCVNGKHILLKEFANTWQPIYNSSLSSDIDYGCYSDDQQDYEMYNSSDDLFVYFVTLSQGSQLGTAYFNVYSYKEDKLYTIEAFGAHGAYNDFYIPDDLKNNRVDILKYLEDKMSKSKYIYHQTKEDLDLSLQQNAMLDWQINNDINKLKGLDSININVRKFKSTTIDKFFDEDTSRDYIEGSKFDFEGKKYRITSYFKGSIFCLDKYTNEYFVLFVPGDIYDWVEKIEFKDDSNIVLYDRMNDVGKYKIDIDNLILSIL